MDGYAVRLRPTRASRAETTPVRLRIVERIYTGQVSPRARSTPARCAEIATGAPLPEGADAVVMVEETVARRRRPASTSSPRPPPGQNIGRRGADISPGDLVVRARRSPEPEPHRRAGRDRLRRRRGLRAAARRDAVDRQRSDRAGRAAGRRPDLRRQPLHARARSSRAHGGIAGAAPAGAGHARRARRARSTRARTPTSSCSPAAARSANAI